MERIGLLFPGEMGTLLGSAAAGQVLWASEGRSDASARRAEAAGFRDTGTLCDLVAASDVVLGVCPPAIAEDVADQVAGAGFHGLYVEANAIAPARAERIAGVLVQGGARVVDAAVIARNRLNLYVSGEPEDVGQVTELFEGSDVAALSLGGGVGAASALKMAFGGWNEIGIALAAQAFAIARAYGVEDALAGEGAPAQRPTSSSAGSRTATVRRASARCSTILQLRRVMQRGRSRATACRSRTPEVGVARHGRAGSRG